MSYQIDIEHCPACREMAQTGLTYEETHSTNVPGFLALEGGDQPTSHAWEGKWKSVQESLSGRGLEQLQPEEVEPWGGGPARASNIPDGYFNTARNIREVYDRVHDLPEDTWDETGQFWDPRGLSAWVGDVWDDQNNPNILPQAGGLRSTVIHLMLERGR